MATREVPTGLGLGQHRRRFVVQWIVWVTLAESAAFALAAFVGIIATFTVPDRWVAYGILVSAGAAEGTLLALGQWTAFYRSRAQIPPGQWVGATAFGAAVAWAVIALPTAVGIDLGEAVSTTLLIVLGVVALLAVPVLQSLVLGRHRQGAAKWVIITLVSWGVSLGWLAAPFFFVDAATEITTLFIVFAVAGLGMALTASVVSGLWARSLVIPESPLVEARISRPAP